jgi:hypothetical protein
MHRAYIELSSLVPSAISIAAFLRSKLKSIAILRFSLLIQSLIVSLKDSGLAQINRYLNRSYSLPA